VPLDRATDAHGLIERRQVLGKSLLVVAAIEALTQH
jgi:hypothetical protein